jgi:hypothetical protein
MEKLHMEDIHIAEWPSLRRWPHAEIRLHRRTQAPR